MSTIMKDKQILQIQKISPPKMIMNKSIKQLIVQNQTHVLESMTEHLKFYQLITFKIQWFQEEKITDIKILRESINHNNLIKITITQAKLRTSYNLMIK